MILVRAVRRFGAARPVDAVPAAEMRAWLLELLAGHSRRADDWALQTDLAAKEIEQLEKQIAGAEVRVAVAEKELANHDIRNRERARRGRLHARQVLEPGAVRNVIEDLLLVVDYRLE